MTGSMKAPGPTGKISGSWKRGCGSWAFPMKRWCVCPGGSLNAQADPQVLREILTGLSRDGYTVFDWTVTSGDDGGEGQPVPLPPEVIARNTLERGEGQSSPVILLHDSHPFTTTPEAARQIIRAYKARGYRFGVLTADTRPLVFSDWWDVLSGD